MRLYRVQEMGAIAPARSQHMFEVKRWRYSGFDPSDLSAPAVFKVYQLGTLVALVREPLPLPDDPASPQAYRVDCREESDDLRAFLAGYFPGQSFEYVEDSTWTWTTDGAAVTTPWD